MRILLALTLSFATISTLPVGAEVEQIETESYSIRLPQIDQVYLLLMTQSNIRGVKSSAHSTFPMPDINQCEKEGKRWKTTAIDGINGNDKSYYCVKGSR